MSMKVIKEQRDVEIVLVDGNILTGKVHINPGERIFDFINDNREEFIVVTETTFVKKPAVYIQNKKVAESTIILNKSSIKWLEEI